MLNRQSGYRKAGTNADLSVTYEYDDKNNLASMTETVGGVSKTYTYTYDDDNRIISETVNGVTVEYTYDGFGRLETRVVKNGDTVIHTGTPTYSPGKEANTTTGQIASYNGYTYTYDANGNILSVSDGTNTTSYEYDSANQLIRENNQAGNDTHTWTYDNAGNITSRKEYAYTTGSLEGITAVSTVSYTYGDSDWGDLLTGYGSNNITYDTIGNPLSDGEWSYVWQHGRQLASMSQGTTTWAYTYDADGMRTGRTDGTNAYTYVYNGSKLTAMTKAADALAFTYDASGTPLTVAYNGTVYYYKTNIQGDVIAILDGSGNPVVSYAYDAWGVLLGTNGTMASTLGALNPLRYRGYVYDPETALYYLQSRYYNPEIGRFINADALVATGQGFVGNNMFAYCEGNPILKRDNTGHFGIIALCIIGFVAGGAIEYGSQVYDNYQQGKTGSDAWTDVNVGEIASSSFSGAVTAFPGGGFAATVIDVLGSAAIEQGVNCVVENKSWDWNEYSKDVNENIFGEIVSFGIDAPDKVPKYIRDIKDEARTFGIKGTKKLTKYLDFKQFYIILNNTLGNVLTDSMQNP